MYSTDEILKHLTEGEGRGFLGRSIYDVIYFRIEELETQLQQKENIIKEVKEYIKRIPKDDGYMGYLQFTYGDRDNLLEILDKQS